METETPKNELTFRNTRRMGIVFLIYAIVFPFVTLIVPENEVPVGTASIILSWLMIFLMPIETLLIYVLYHYSGKRFGLNNFQALAVLMYIFAIAPSVYAFVIGFTDSSLRSVAIPMGLVFSLIGFWLALKLLSNHWDALTAYNQP
jgi:hypothetical protein